LFRWIRGRFATAPIGRVTEASWNGQWNQFFNSNQNYTKQDVLNQLSLMKKKLG